MAESKILVARKDEVAFIDVVGRGSFQNAGLIKSFYRELLKTGTQYFIVNLKECTYLDSTFLGTLAGLGAALKQKNNSSLHILNANERNLELLRNLGLDRLFDIKLETSNLDKKELTELKSPLENNKEDKKQEILEAHLNLMNWDDKNVAKFKDVVTYLKEDLGFTHSE